MGVRDMCRAAHDAKLGAAAVTATYSPLSAVRGDGGSVPRTALVLLRKYPQLVSQRMADGRTRTRTHAAFNRTAKAQHASTESVRKFRKLCGCCHVCEQRSDAWAERLPAPCCVSAACMPGVWQRWGLAAHVLLWPGTSRGASLSCFCTPFIVFDVFAALCLRWGPGHWPVGLSGHDDFLDSLKLGVVLRVQLHARVGQEVQQEEVARCKDILAAGRPICGSKGLRCSCEESSDSIPR